MVGSKGRTIYPWGKDGYKEDVELNFNVPDKRPHVLEAQANEILAVRRRERARLLVVESESLRNPTAHINTQGDDNGVEEKATPLSIDAQQQKNIHNPGFFAAPSDDAKEGDK